MAVLPVGILGRATQTSAEGQEWVVMSEVVSGTSYRQTDWAKNVYGGVIVKTEVEVDGQGVSVSTVYLQGVRVVAEVDDSGVATGYWQLSQASVGILGDD